MGNISRKIIFILVLSFNYINLNASKSALIFGITGQDGSYLAELLNSKGYEIYGISRIAGNLGNNHAIKYLSSNSNIHLYSLDILKDENKITDLILDVLPDEIYNLAGQTNVASSLNQPEETIKTNISIGLAVLGAIRKACKSSGKQIKLFQAVSSEIIKKNPNKDAEDEDIIIESRSPYGASKLAIFDLSKCYRKNYDLFICNGILFNHESVRRPVSFLIRKITKFIADFSKGQAKCLEIGNLDSKKDYGNAKDYVEAMWLMLQQETPEDYIIASGSLYTVREIIEKAFKAISITISWQGEGINAKGYNQETGDLIVEVNKEFYRDAYYGLKGDNSKALTKLNWKPNLELDFLIKEMIDHDLKA